MRKRKNKFTLPNMALINLISYYTTKLITLIAVTYAYGDLIRILSSAMKDSMAPFYLIVIPMIIISVRLICRTIKTGHDPRPISKLWVILLSVILGFAIGNAFPLVIIWFIVKCIAYVIDEVFTEQVMEVDNTVEISVDSNGRLQLDYTEQNGIYLYNPSVTITYNDTTLDSKSNWQLREKYIVGYYSKRLDHAFRIFTLNHSKPLTESDLARLGLNDRQISTQKDVAITKSNTTAPGTLVKLYENEFIREPFKDTSYDTPVSMWEPPEKDRVDNDIAPTNDTDSDETTEHDIATDEVITDTEETINDDVNTEETINDDVNTDETVTNEVDTDETLTDEVVETTVNTDDTHSEEITEVDDVVETEEMAEEVVETEELVEEVVETEAMVEDITEDVTDSVTEPENTKELDYEVTQNGEIIVNVPVETLTDPKPRKKRKRKRNKRKKK